MNATTTTQGVQAQFDAHGRLVLTFNDTAAAVDQAGSAGMEDGQRVVSNALAAVVGADLKRAGELLRVVQQADRIIKEHDGVLAAIDRKQAAASGLLFGPSLDKRVAELERERDAAADKRVAALGDRSDALRELQAIRDRAVGDGVKAVARTLAARRTAAATERQQTADRLGEAVEGLLAKMLALDAELGELNRTSADDAMTDHLEAVLPDVFAVSGLAPAEPYDWRSEREQREEESQRRGWDRLPPLPWPGDDREDG